MTAMVLHRVGSPLRAESLPVPEPEPGQVLLRVRACAVCRTDLHLVQGELPPSKLPVIPGHEIVGVVEKLGEEVTAFKIGDRAGVPWLGWTCGSCKFCISGRENLCDQAKFTGYTLDGGYADYVVADARFCFPIPRAFQDIEAAPLLCAGLIGYRCFRKAGAVSRLGIYGFGAAAHILIQIAKYQGCAVYAFTRPGDLEAQRFATELGAVWAGDATQRPPNALHAAIIFAPVGALVPAALKNVEKGGTVVCGGIHMSAIPKFPYNILWGERTISSVANLTRQDGLEFFQIAAKAGVKTRFQKFHLTEANDALLQLRDGKLQGAAVLLPD
jgi:alcohol dehydrogenase, propanol-preferring